MPTEAPAIAVITHAASAQFASIRDSPLDGRANVIPVPWTAEMAASERAATLDAVLPQIDGLVFSPWVKGIPTFDKNRWKAAARLRVVAGAFDNRFHPWLDLGEAAEHGVTIVDTSRSMTPTVAEFALAMTFNLLRDIPAAIEKVRQGGWRQGATWDQPGFVEGDLGGRRVGLAGLGVLNKRYAELIGPFECDAYGYDPFVDRGEFERLRVTSVDSLVELASQSEIFLIGIPPTPATLGIVSKEVIDALPRGALVLVMTRMAVVDQSALWRRAETGELRVAVDVFDPEPPPADASFRTSPWVLPTPHIAGGTFAAHRRCFTAACTDALSVLSGQEPKFRTVPRDALLYSGQLRSDLIGGSPWRHS